METWRVYQHETAQFFRDLGCIVEVDASVQGARARHAIDVWVRFARFGLQQAWVIECKLWQRAVPKEKVLALKSIVDDVGADRGILLAESGHQAGARSVVSATNITLTTLDELRQSAKADLLRIALSTIFERSVRLKQRMHSLWDHESWNRDGMRGSTSRPKPGVDGEAMMRALGTVSIIQLGLEQAQLGNRPLPFRFDESGERLIQAPDLESFVAAASEVLSELERIVANQQHGTPDA